MKTPTANDLGRAPQLAVLAALDATLRVALLALVDAHPEVHDSEQVRESNPHVVAAHRLCIRILELERVLDAYVDAIEQPLARDPIDEGPLDGRIQDIDF